MKRFIFFSILLSINVFSQEIESHLLVNSILDKNERYYSKKSFSNLVVPFIDDFSYKSNIPDRKQNLKNYVYQGGLDLIVL